MLKESIEELIGKLFDVTWFFLVKVKVIALCLEELIDFSFNLLFEILGFPIRFGGMLLRRHS